MLSLSQIIDKVVGWLVRTELKILWKKTSRRYFVLLPQNLPEGTEEIYEKS